MSEWQPIETAPRDGTAILVWPGVLFTEMTYFHTSVVRWHDWKEAWIEASGEEYNTFYPTHWMPLPPPPKKGNE